jgi:16S rRNA (cytosine967-C5)-methyltransferase
LQLNSIEIEVGDSRDSDRFNKFHNIANRVLLDAPCSGLGTLHKRPDIRWRQTQQGVEELFQLQKELIQQTAQWVKPQGILVYATCTLNVLENEKVVQSFLANNSNWSVQTPNNAIAQNWVTDPGWIKVYPHRSDMDGFFMVRLQRNR